LVVLSFFITFTIHPQINHGIFIYGVLTLGSPNAVGAVPESLLSVFNNIYYSSVILSLLFTTLVYQDTKPSASLWAQIHTAGKIPLSLGSSLVSIYNNQAFLRGTLALP
jgi:hypothetical protein